MQPTAAEQFAADPRVAQAKRLILEALTDHQLRLKGPQPPSPDRRAAYEQMIESFGQLRGGPLVYPYLGSGFGSGPLVELEDGSVKYDMIGGIGVHVAGHNHHDMVEAALDAAIGDTIMQGNLQQNIESARLAQTLVTMATPSGAQLSNCFLTTSGAMANENALKLVFSKHHPADRLLAFEDCFMGRSITLAQVTDKPAYRAGLPATVGVDYVPFYDTDKPRASTDLAVEILIRYLDCHPNQHAAMCFELVLGEGGYYPGNRSFFEPLMRLLKQRGIAVLIDEVQTFGRTTRPFAFSHFGLDQYVDIATIGKMTQVCATLFTDAYRPPPGLVSQTFTAASSAIFAAQAILDEFTSGNYFGSDGRIAQVHERFVAHLIKMQSQRPDAISGPFGIGGMIAFTAFGGDTGKTKAFLASLFDNGVIAFMAGSQPTRVRLLPPVMATRDEDIDAVARIMEQTIDQM